MLSVRVVERHAETQDIFRLELQAADGGALPMFTAGSHIDVRIAPGLTRQYSLCNPPGECHRYVIAVLNEALSRGGSRTLWARAVPGSKLSISPPRNFFELDETAEASLLFAGGIGITPLLSMAARLQQLGREFELHHCARSREHAAFVEHVRNGPYSARASHHFDDGREEQRLKLKKILRRADPDAHLYVCGPAGFMDFVMATALDMGWAETHLHREYFAAPVTPLAGSVTVPDTAFEVALARQGGRRVQVPAGKSIVQALRSVGVEIPVSCEAGICGSCKTTVIEGAIEHRDRILNAQEREAGKVITPCCSRARSALLVLDL